MDLDFVTLSPQETAKLLSAGSGDAALVYLYMRATGDSRLEHAQERLHMPAQNLGWAETMLGRLGLTGLKQPEVRYDRERAPIYSSEDVTRASGRDPSFSMLQGEVSRRLGRVLSTEELKTLLTIRDYLKLPPEVVSMALTCCLQRTEYYNQTHGTSRKVTMRSLERECYEWANKGITTLELASEYISRSLAELAPEAQVKKLMQLDRPLVESEREYIRSWLRMGFPPETIYLAYERTVLATGKLAWRYMNKILLRWHEKNLHTPAEVQSGDGKTGAQSPRSGTGGFVPGDSERASIASLQRFRDSLKEE